MEIIPNVHLIPGMRGANAYLLLGSTLTLVDTGMPGSEETILGYIEGLGLSAADLARIVITHYHLDHVGSLAAIKARTSAQVLAHAGRRTVHLGRAIAASSIERHHALPLLAGGTAYARPRPCAGGRDRPGWRPPGHIRCVLRSAGRRHSGSRAGSHAGLDRPALSVGAAPDLRRHHRPPQEPAGAAAQDRSPWTWSRPSLLSAAWPSSSLTCSAPVTACPSSAGQTNRYAPWCKPWIDVASLFRQSGLFGLRRARLK